LDRSGSLRTYIERVCSALRVNIDTDVYAANLANNFFSLPPATLPSHALELAAAEWAPVLNMQLRSHPNAIVLSLGEPVLATLVPAGGTPSLRWYWGYQGTRRPLAAFRSILLARRLGRRVFPFPHSTVALTKPFYRGNLADYCAYVAREAGWY